MVLGRQPITFGTRKARVPAAEVLHAPKWPCPAQAGPKWPKLTKNGPRGLRRGPQKVPLSKLMDKINYGTVLVAFLALFGSIWPRNGVRWAQNGLIWALNVSCGLKPKNGRSSG